jgi:hypothetical protein
MSKMSRAARRTIVASCAAAVVLISGLGVALAQTFSLPPTYGAIQLGPGFMPDPVTVNLTAGGPINTSTSGPAPACGWVANAPDYRVNWRGGSNLFFTATAATDTTLLINAPNGGWQCNDDSNGFNPSIAFRGAPAGQYDVWVGTYSSGNAPAVLRVSEMGPRW